MGQKGRCCVNVSVFPDRISWSRPEFGVGVDFGASSVKLVALARERTEIRLVAAGSEPLPSGVVREGAVLDGEAAGDALERLVGRLGVRSRTASVGVGGRAYLVKRLVLPEGSAGEEGSLRQAVEAEAARHIPFHMQDLLFDFERGRAWNGEGGRCVVFGAARRDLVLSHGRAVARAGLAPRRVEIEPYGLLAAWELENRLGDSRAVGEQPISIVEVGASHVAVHVFRFVSPSPGGDAVPWADLAASVQAPGGGVGTGSEEAFSESPLGKRVAAALAEALAEAGLAPPCSVRLSGGGAGQKEIHEVLRPLARGEPAVLDPIGFFDSERRDPALAFAAGLAKNHLEDSS